MSTSPDTLFALLRLTLTDGLGPVLISRMLGRFQSPEEALKAGPGTLRTIEGIGPKKAQAIADSMAASADHAKRELELAAKLGVRLITYLDAEYPALLGELPDRPPLLYVRGSLLPEGADRFPLAMVGSRECTAYALEQAARFAGILGKAGLTIVSGGARGIDSAAHRGALDAGGRTIAVLGCGLSHCYPPENMDLFERIMARGAIISELPLGAAPHAENFPARNRIISGLSLGVLIVEAGVRSGSLITARVAAEDHGREVMVIPSRIDSPAARGGLELLRSGGAHLVIEPGDVLAILEAPAVHIHLHTHEQRYPASQSKADSLGKQDDLDSPDLPSHERVVRLLAEPRTIDEVIDATGLEPSEVRAVVTMLEIQRRVRREGSRLTLTR